MVISGRNEAKYLEKVKTSKMFCPSVKFLSLPHSLRGHVRRRLGGGWVGLLGEHRTGLYAQRYNYIYRVF